MDAISEARLGEVYPRLAEAIRRMADMFAEEFPDNSLRVTQGLRTWAQQAALYAQGRMSAGPIVTDAKPGYSWHNFGLAVDLVPMGISGPDWNTQHPQWVKLISLAPTVGLFSGAQFRTFKDMPHFQLTGRFGLSPDDEARHILSTEGIEAFWASAFRSEVNNVA